MDYRQHIEAGSMLNTPPVFAIYVCLLTLRWLKHQGGIAAIEKINKAKADLLYKTLDEKPGFEPTVAKEDRSRMNVVFLIKDAELEKKFLVACKEQQMVGVKGHRSVGGYRVSLYNALPLESVQALTHPHQSTIIFPMAIISAFRALRPTKELAPRVASVPYDVLSSTEARIVADKNPYSFLHITKAEIDLPEETDPHSDKVYHKAADNLFIFRDHKILQQDEKPSYYIYELTMGDRKQTGLVCVSSVEDYEHNIIKKHELTRPDKELDRINHMRITGAQTGNVFLAYKTNVSLSQLISSWKESHEAANDFVADDGVGHRIWVVHDPQTISENNNHFSQTDSIYLYRRRASPGCVCCQSKNALGKEASPEAGWFLTTLFPSDELRIMDYNRVVKDLNGLDATGFPGQAQ